MNLTILAKNFELTQSLKLTIEEKMRKLEKYISNPTIKVVLEVNNIENRIEVFVSNFKKDIKVEVVDKDMYAAIDVCIDKLKLQLDKYLSKKESKNGESIRYPENKASQSVEDITDIDQFIVKRKQFDLKPMMEAEAILQMEMLGHNSFMFFNADIEAICMIYKRNDGKYGIIETM